MKSTWLIGIDEAGRGPIAGPVAVGVVVVKGELPDDLKLTKDSKKLTPKARAEWFNKIRLASKNNLLQFACVLVSAQVIDRSGIFFAIKKSLKSGLGKIIHEPKETLVLLDGGLKAPTNYPHQKTIIKGDEKESIIALASVVAKVTRDFYMTKMAEQYPNYGFAQHKGYGTKNHYLAIQKHGLSPIHRRSFLGSWLLFVYM